jgi:integrase
VASTKTHAKRRARGDGSVHKRPDGRWAGILSEQVGGRRMRRYVYGRTKAEAARKLRQLLLAAEGGTPAGDDRTTFAAFVETWLEHVLPQQVKDSTVSNYTTLLRRHALPTLGGRPMNKLTPEHIEALCAAKLDEGLSPRTVALVHTVVRRALSEAERRGRVRRNVGRIAVAPRVPRHEARTLTPAQARKLLAAARGDELETFVTVALSCGLRHGEALGLRWDDVDVDAKVLRVKRTLRRKTGAGLVTTDPKSATSRRTVPIPAVCLRSLSRQRKRQAAARRAAGRVWTETGYVFTSAVGTPMDPANVRHRFTRLTIAAGLGPWTPHELRHSAASLLLAQGVPLKVVSDLLGHSSITITADVYSHVLPELQREAAMAMDRALKMHPGTAVA